MKYYAKIIGGVWCVAIDDGKFAHRDNGHVWGCDSEQQAIDLAEMFNDEVGEQAATIARLTTERDKLAAYKADASDRFLAVLDQRDAAEREATRLTAENERLKEVVERLPKTADGVTVTDPVELFWRDRLGELRQGAGGLVEETMFPLQDRPGSHLSPSCGIAGCYSTREAALAAQPSEGG